MNDDRLYLIHIDECIRRIESYVAAGGRDGYRMSTLIQDAVLRNLQTLAESTQRLSDQIKATHTETDWRRLAGFRNILVHDYFGIDLDRVWNIIEHELPSLKTSVQTMFKELDV
jgi:uncharacterized protein with HEPN domain